MPAIRILATENLPDQPIQATTPVPNPQNVVRILVVGDPMVGKSALVSRYMGRQYSERYMATIVSEYDSTRAMIRNLPIGVVISDISTPATYALRDAGVILLVFDLTNYTSFLNLTSYLDRVYSVAGYGVPVVLVGNKCDKAARAVASSELDHFIGEHPSIIAYIEASAATHINIKPTFECAIEYLVDKSRASPRYLKAAQLLAQTETHLQELKEKLSNSSSLAHWFWHSSQNKKCLDAKMAVLTAISDCLKVLNGRLNNELPRECWKHLQEVLADNPLYSKGLCSKTKRCVDEVLTLMTPRLSDSSYAP